jgi:adenylate kinase family enzyme
MYEKMLDLRMLLKKYLRHQVKWYDIGLHLGIQKYALDIIKHDCQDKSGDCFREMLDYWLKNDMSADESRLQKATEDAEGLTNSFSASCNKWLETPGNYLRVIILPIILGVIMYYLHSSSPLTTAAEILKTEYRAQKVINFNLPISWNSDLEHLGVVIKDTDGHEFGHSELLQTYSGEGGRLIVTGLPGSGKTTLLRKLAKEWANGRVLKSCQILFLISLGSLKGEVNTLRDLLSKSGFGDLVNLKDISEKIYATNGAGACFLLDAYDELINESKYLDEIIEGNKIHSSFCLLTSRPFSSKNFKEITQFAILGYNIDNLASYLHRLSDNATLVSAIQRSWDNNPKVKEMCTLPLHMAMMLYIYSYESSVSFRTTTQLYIAFMNVTIKHYEGHRLDWNTEILWQCILAKAHHGDDLCSAFNILHQVAYNTVFKYPNSFSGNKAFKDRINQLSFVGVTSVPGSESLVKFTFLHPTFLEFFAALHLTTLPLNEQLAFITANRMDCYNDIRIRKYAFHKMYVVFYLGLIGNKFQYNISGATPFLKQLFIKTSLDSSQVCVVYKKVEEAIGWTTQQYRNTIDSVFEANYSMCAYHSTLSETCFVYHSGHISFRQDTGELGLVDEIGWDNSANIIVDFYVNLTRQDQVHLLLCMRGLGLNSDSNCHGLRLPSVTSLTIFYHPWAIADTLYKMKKVLPNLEHIDIKLLIFNFLEFNRELESLQTTRKQHEIVSVLWNLKIDIHLDVNFDRCRTVEGTKIFPIDEINHVSLRRITLTGVCHDSFAHGHLCKSVLQYSTFVEDAVHAQSLVTCIQQAQNLKTLSLAYYEGATDKIKQKEFFRNLPQTLQTLNVCGFEQLKYFSHCTFEGTNGCKVSSTLDVKLIANALTEKKNLRRLTISISNVEDMKILTQLTFLRHLHIILDDSLVDDRLVDKSTILPIVNPHLRYFPHLESFALTVGHFVRYNDEQMILSIIFDISPARDIRFNQYNVQGLSQFRDITINHIFSMNRTSDM